MIVRVVYRNAKYDMVKTDFLDDLITSGKIERFHRSGGWARVDRDPIRGRGGIPYYGPERRKSPNQ